jgi:glutamyl-tRNA reductase
MITRRMVRKILHNPIIVMRASESGIQREQLIDSIRQLFNDSGIADR